MKKRFFGLVFSFLTILIIASGPSVRAYTLDDATALYNLGIDYYSQNQVQKSMDCFKKATAIDPKFYEAYYNLAQIQASYGYLDAAINSYEKVVQLKPQDVESLYELGLLLYKKGYLKRAIAYLDKIPPASSVAKEAATLEQKIKKRQAELNALAKEKEQMKAQLQNKMTIDMNNKEPISTPDASLQKEETLLKPAVIENSNIVAQMQAPSGVASDDEGNIFAASFSENKVYKISSDGTKSVYVESNQLGGPIGIAIDEFNNLYIANYTKNNILKVTPSGVISEFTQLRKPYCIGIDVKRKALVVTEQDTNNVLRFAL